jgi:DNA helicase-2/ATP-dependent DNA helicase PcrA
VPLSALNTEQHAAATAPLHGANLVIASAGTGKTSTIVARIAYLLQNGIAPETILLLTFTNKAAGEMIARLERHFPAQTVSKIEAGTFHAVSYRWLKARDPKLTLKQPAELKTLFRSLYEKRQFARMNLPVAPLGANHLYDLYQLYQNASTMPWDVWLLQRYPEHTLLADIYVDLIETFEAEKRQYGFVSFNDLLVRALDLLQTDPIPYTEVLVDEYQDTNTLQSALIDALKPPSLFCVGDYDQSIYAFNGADIANIATFADRYPQARVFSLMTNYRSTAPILSLANRVIERNERIYPKQLRVGRSSQGAHAPRLLMFDELFEQYQTIAEMIRTSATPHDRVAVLFRNNASADGIEASLRERGIPSRRKGGTSFFDAKEIKFLLDLITLLINPDDMMAFIHVFEYAPGVGSALAKELFMALRHFGDGDIRIGTLTPLRNDLPKFNPNKNTQLGLFDDDIHIGSITRFAPLALPDAVRTHPLLKHPRIAKEGVEFFADFHTLLEHVRRISVPETILERCIASPLYARIVKRLSTQRAQLKTGEIDPERQSQAQERIERKARLLRDLSRPYRDLRAFFNAMVLGGSELSEGEGVHLLSVHGAKGLEFSDVYVVDLMDGRFPNHKLMNQSGGAIEEERRLFYVAVTRARDRLFLSMARFDRIKKIAFEPSPFLFEAGLLRETEPSEPNQTAS